jgi:hypothetical protein
MALEGFKPTIWSGALLEQLQKSLVFAAVCNRDYEGEITNFGDRVKINEIGEITVSAYTETTTVTPQRLGDAQKELLIDQADFFAFRVDDVTAVQMKPKVMQSAMTKAAYQLRNTVDQYLAGLHAQAGVTGSIGTTTVPISITSVNVVEYFGLIEQGLNEQNVPLENRWIVIPPWLHQKLVLAKVQLITDNTGVFENGLVGKALGFNIYLSNNLKETSAKVGTKVLAGHPMAITLAEQLTKLEAYRIEASFSEAIKGLLVFGAKIIVPSALACLTASYAAEP